MIFGGLLSMTINKNFYGTISLIGFGVCCIDYYLMNKYGDFVE